MKEKVVELKGMEHDNTKYLYYIARDKEDGKVYVWRTARKGGKQ